MKAVILAGGKGTRLAEETSTRPKPMVEIGGSPILWHIMKGYAAHGVDEFVVCLGHKGGMIKEWFVNHNLRDTDIEVDMRAGTVSVLRENRDPWRVILAETGEDSLTGTRLAIARRYLTPGETFCMTYGDGVGDVDIGASIAAHKAAVAAEGRVATVTAVRPAGRFGSLELRGDLATGFVEKAKGESGWINAGFFVMEPAALDFIPDEDCMWEEAPVRAVAAAGKLGVFRHEGFWLPMDTLRDRQKLEELWARGNPPWKVWGGS